MLRRNVIDAVKAGKFHIYPVSHIDQCLELLTGLPTGERDVKGEFPKDSLNWKICKRLVDLAEKRRNFSGANSK